MSQSSKNKTSLKIRSNLVNLDIRPKKLEIDVGIYRTELDKLYGALQIIDKEFFKRLVEDEELSYSS